MSRPALARVDLTALVHNYRLARMLHGNRALAVIKANAYGHGALACAKALQNEADGFGVAFLDEAIPLRQSNISKPILLLEGVFDENELAEASRSKLWIVVHNEDQVRMIELAGNNISQLNVWVKIDSGMHRAGFRPTQTKNIYSRLLSSRRVSKVTFMTHFSCADEPGKDVTCRQIASFELATNGIVCEQSLANSSAILSFPVSHRDWARPGILLYGGIAPQAKDLRLLPVMTLESAIMGVKTLQKGDSVGYGEIYVASRTTRVGLVAIGYADGYPRSAKQGTPILVDGMRTILVGRVSMDMLTVDLTELPHCGMGSKVVLWGDGLSVVDVADSAGTISYELLANVKRVKFQYVDAHSNHARSQAPLFPPNVYCLHGYPA